MKALSIALGAGVLACNSGPGPCAQTGQFVGQPVSPFAANKPWQGSTPSSWQNSPPSVWTSPQGQPATPALPRPPNPSLAGRSPSEQLQITKCRSAQSCEKCRQLNCYWDSTAKITNRCIALGLESTIPVEAGQASNLGYCPANGQQGYVGVNWLAIEKSGAAVPNLEGMSDANVQQWLSSIPNYDPDATGANYPAGDAFKDLLPTAAKAYSEGKIPSTTPWISFFDSLSAGYSYDGYLEGSYSYDVPSSDYYGGPYLGASGFGGTSNFGSWDSSYPSFAPSFGGAYPTTTALGSTISPQGGLPLASQLYVPQSLPSFPQPLGSPLGLGSTLPGQPIGFGAPLPMQPIGTFPTQPIGFGPSQPIGSAFSPQPLGFGQPALSSWSGF